MQGTTTLIYRICCWSNALYRFSWKISHIENSVFKTSKFYPFTYPSLISDSLSFTFRRKRKATLNLRFCEGTLPNGCGDPLHTTQYSCFKRPAEGRNVWDTKNKINCTPNCVSALHNSPFDHYMKSSASWGFVECQFILVGVLWRSTGGASRRRWRRRVHGTALCQHKVTSSSTLTQPLRSLTKRAQYEGSVQVLLLLHTRREQSRRQGTGEGAASWPTNSEYMNVIVWGQQVSWWRWAFSGEAQTVGCNTVHKMQSNFTAQHSTAQHGTSTHMYILLSLVRFPT